jgi:hypothetical protein
MHVWLSALITYEISFGLKVRFKISASHVRCTWYIVSLWKCLRGTWKSFPFPVRLVLCVPTDHVRECYIYGNNFRKFSATMMGCGGARSEGRGEWDEAKTNYRGSAIRKGPGVRLCCFRWYNYFSIVQIYPFRSGTSHSATKSRSFRECVKICSWSALTWIGGDWKKFYRGP